VSVSRLNRLLHEAHRETVKLISRHKSRELEMIRGSLESALEWLDNYLQRKGE